MKSIGVMESLNSTSSLCIGTPFLEAPRMLTVTSLIE